MIVVVVFWKLFEGKDSQYNKKQQGQPKSTKKSDKHPGMPSQPPWS